MEDTKVTLAKWNAHLDFCKAKVKRGETLTKDEDDFRDFIEQKLDDYRSDYYGMENY
jgi:hypothetical protein